MSNIKSNMEIDIKFRLEAFPEPSEHSDGKLIMITYGETPDTSVNIKSQPKGIHILPTVRHFKIGDVDEMVSQAMSLSELQMMDHRGDI